MSIVVTHSSGVHKIIKLPKDRSVYSYLMPWLGEGLLISEDKKWMRNRRLLTPAFHYEILRGYVPVINDCLEIFLKKWTVSAKEGLAVYAFQDVSKLSLDIIMRCAFSSKSDCQLLENEYINGIDKISTLIDDRFLSLIYRCDFVYNLSASGKKFNKLLKVSHDYTESVIRERKKSLGIEGFGVKKDVEAILEKAKDRKYLDFLDILLTAQDEEGKGLTDKEIRDEADTFMFEGHDTTTSGMSWTLYCLAKHPGHQDKVREEVKNALMGREFLEYDDLKDLKYTTWCIKEAMRLYPPVTNLIRITTEDTEIDGHVIPEGTAVFVDIKQIHLHPDTWENPMEYDPLRFHPSNAEGRDPYAYIPFSAGYRNCIGQTFALNEERMVIASIINRFQVSLDETHEVELLPKIILRAKNDIKLILNSNNS